MEKQRSSELDIALKQYNFTKAVYSLIEEEWQDKERWLQSLPNYLLFPLTVLLDTGIDIREINKIDLEKQKLENSLISARSEVEQRLTNEIGIYDIDGLFFNKKREPGTLVTLFHADLDGETFHSHTQSARVAIAKDNLEIPKVEIASLNPPILHVPHYYINVTLYKGNEIEDHKTVDLRERNEITVYPGGGIQ